MLLDWLPIWTRQNDWPRRLLKHRPAYPGLMDCRLAASWCKAGLYRVLAVVCGTLPQRENLSTKPALPWEVPKLGQDDALPEADPPLPSKFNALAVRTARLFASHRSSITNSCHVLDPLLVLETCIVRPIEFHERP